MATIPNQVRSIDAFSDSRFSSVFNRLSRIVTAGNDVILFPNSSYQFSIFSPLVLRITPGICIKDDVLVHTVSNFDLDFTDADNFVDPNVILAGAPTSYYIVLEYRYARTLPAPKAVYKIVKDITAYYTPYKHRYVFLGQVDISYDSGLGEYYISSFAYTSNIHVEDTRPYAEGGLLSIDGGWIVE